MDFWINKILKSKSNSKSRRMFEKWNVYLEQNQIKTFTNHLLEKTSRPFRSEKVNYTFWLIRQEKIELWTSYKFGSFVSRLFNRLMQVENISLTGFFGKQIILCVFTLTFKHFRIHQIQLLQHDGVTNLVWSYLSLIVFQWCVIFQVSVLTLTLTFPI